MFAQLIDQELNRFLTPQVISDTSFESGMSDDYAIPPDALSQSESSCMDASMPSFMMRASYADSPNKKLESLEKVCVFVAIVFRCVTTKQNTLFRSVTLPNLVVN